jgi:hypothetical protein
MRSRNAGSHDMSLSHSRMIEGRREDDLVATIIRALDIARSCQSVMTIDLLKMALLNEGVGLAAALSRENAALDARGELSPPSCLNTVSAQRIPGRAPPISTSRSARSKAARPRRSPVADRRCPGACETHLSIGAPVQPVHPTAEPPSNALVKFLTSFPIRD